MIVATDSIQGIKQHRGIVSLDFVPLRGEHFDDAVNRAVKALQRQANELGANAISSLRIEAVPMNAGHVLYVAYGTAVTVAF